MMNMMGIKSFSYIYIFRNSNIEACGIMSQFPSLSLFGGYADNVTVISAETGIRVQSKFTAFTSSQMHFWNVKIFLYSYSYGLNSRVDWVL